MEQFTQAYLECALWAGFQDDEGDYFTIHDFSPQAKAQAESDCAKFQTENETSLALAYQHEGYHEAQAGHDFFLTRCGHGAGFWDRGLGATGETMSSAAERYREWHLYVDNNLIYAE